MPQVLPAIGGFFSWVGGIFGVGGGAGVGAGVGTAAAGGTGIAGGIAAVGTGVATGAGAVGGGAIASGTIASQLANLALQMALSAVISVAFKPGMASTSGAPLDFKADPNGAVPLVLGRTATGASTVYAEVYGGDKARFLRFVSVLSACGPIQGVESFKANEKACVFDGTRNETDYYHNIMWQDYKLGNQPETAHTASNPPWGSVAPTTFSSAHKLSGLASVQWILRYNQTKYSTGVPTPIWVVLGPKVYDPRKDSTYPGGSGPQRWNDESTWSFTGNDNPHLQALTWCIGRKSNGKLCLGVGLTPAGIDVASFVEGANVSDANGWKVGGVVYSTESKWGILEAILRAGGAKPIPLGAKVTCVTSAPRVSIATLSAADIDGEPQFSSKPGRRDRFNRALFRYREENLDWAFVQGEPVQFSDLITADGEPRTREIDFGLVQDVQQGAQLAAYDVLNAREAGPHRLPLRPRWMGLKPGDCITVTDTELAFNAKVLIRERQRDPMTGSRVLTCFTETDAKHTLALAQAPTTPTPPTYEDEGVEYDPGVIAAPDAGAWSAVGTTLWAVLP